ncbi:MAG: hypothetical protein Q8P18_25955 [Pseudomonadota bacterium]|nr:hypothetical protein [Pseudomonadota bacterium]
MRRVGFESVAVGVATGGLVLPWFGFPAGDMACGADGVALAWRLAHLQEVWEGSAALGIDRGVVVPLAGWTWSALGAVLGAGVGVAAASQALLVLALGSGAAALWGLSRAAGGGLVAAGLATLVGTLPVVAAHELGHGGVDLAVVPFAALALAWLPRPEAWARVAGIVAVAACAACDARTGAILGIAAAAAGGGGWGLLAALASTASGVAAGAAIGALDPADIAAPFVTLRAAALAPGLAALAGALWVVGDRGLRRAAAVGFVCALGPMLSVFGVPLTVGDAAIPLPGVVLAAFAPAGEGWAGGLVVAAVAVALGLGRLAQPRLALILAPVALLEAHVAAVGGVTGAPECLSLEVPVAVRALGEREGVVLNLPVEAISSGRSVGGSAGVHALYLLQRRLHGRPLATGLAPLGDDDPLYGEAGVVLSLDAKSGASRWLMPPARPGDVLRGLGVTEIVVHRSLFPPRALALLDPLLFKFYGAPQRDHAGNVDLYRIRAAGPARPPPAEKLHPLDGPPADGWLSVSEYVAGLEPVAGPADGAAIDPALAAAPGPAPQPSPGAAAGAAPAPAPGGSRERPPTPRHPPKRSPP